MPCNEACILSIAEYVFVDCVMTSKQGFQPAACFSSRRALSIGEVVLLQCCQDFQPQQLQQQQQLITHSKVPPKLSRLGVPCPPSRSC